MRALKYFARAVDDRRSWPTFALAAALVFIGSLLLDALDVKNGLTMVVLIAASGFTADRLRPFPAGEAEAG